MPHVATMGTFSCATIAIGNFKGFTKAQNEAYKADPKSFPAPTDGLSVAKFSSSILYPTSQPLGKTYDRPLEAIMQEIEESNLNEKYIIATLNSAQYIGDNGYLPDELNRWGFQLVDKTKNNWGSVNYIYTRNRSKVEINTGEH